jgi:hypothetical protein
MRVCCAKLTPVVKPELEASMVWDRLEAKQGHREGYPLRSSVGHRAVFQEGLRNSDFIVAHCAVQFLKNGQ